MSLILFGVSGMGIWFWIVTSSDPGAGTWKSWIWAMLVLPGLGSKAGTKAEKACLRVWSSSKLRPPPDTSSSSYTHAHQKITLTHSMISYALEKPKARAN